MSKSLPDKALLPASLLLTLTDVVQNGSGWIVMADGLDRGACPKCGATCPYCGIATTSEL